MVALLVEAVRGGKRQHIDADKVAVGAGLNEPLDGRRRIGIGHIAQRRKQGLALAHGRPFMSCPRKRASSNRRWFGGYWIIRFRG